MGPKATVAMISHAAKCSYNYFFPIRFCGVMLKSIWSKKYLSTDSNSLPFGSSTCVSVCQELQMCKIHLEWLLNCERPTCESLDDGIRGASSSTFKSEDRPPPLSLLLLGENISDDFFSIFHSCSPIRKSFYCYYTMYKKIR